MKTNLLLSMPGPLWGTIFILTLVVLIYSVAKAIMRYLDNNRKN